MNHASDIHHNYLTTIYLICNALLDSLKGRRQYIIWALAYIG